MRTCDEIAAMSDDALAEFVGKPLSNIPAMSDDGTYALISIIHAIPQKWSKNVLVVYRTKRERQEEFFMNLTAKKWVDFYNSTHAAKSPAMHALLYKRERLPEGEIAYRPCTSIMFDPDQHITRISNAWVKMVIETRSRPRRKLKIIFKI